MRFKVTHVPTMLRPEAATILREEMMKARDQVLSAYRGAVVTAIDTTSPYAPIDGNVMRSGVHPEPVPGELRGSVVPSPASEPYVIVQELGRRPGQPGPPLEPIVGWVRRKFGGKDSDVQRIARAVRKKLHERGMPGRHFFARARKNPETKSLARRLILAAVRRWKARLGGDA